MSLPEEGSTEDERIDGFIELELRNILKKASPHGWRDTQEKSNARFNTISEQVQYYDKTFGILMNKTILKTNPRVALKVSMGRRRTAQHITTTKLITMFFALYMEKVIRTVNVS